MADEHRRRISLVEVLVIACTLFLLAGLLLPSTQPAIGAMRRVTCTNNVRQLALANIARAISEDAAFGGYLEPLEQLGDAKDLAEGRRQDAKPSIAVAWPTKLLPVIEEAALYEKILSKDSDRGFPYDAPPAIEVFRCPNDPQLELGTGGISYVVNSGMPDLSGATENQPSDLRANGVCHDQRLGSFGPKVRFGRDFKDGASCTILLSENIHRDPPGTAKQSGNTWLRPAPDAINPEQWYGMSWVVDRQNPRAPRPGLMDRFNKDSRSEEERDEPYAASRSRFARPASEHSKVFIVAFCEGNAREVRDIIDYAVYQQLMTPDGRKAAPADAPDQRFEKTLPDNQRFMTPPLTDADY